jgi:5-methylcytosine-specific restriction endonuclease McrA
MYAASGNIAAFYNSRSWRAKRRAVLAASRNECYDCKERGRYSRASEVHHANAVGVRPDLALSDTYMDSDGTERRQLVALCRSCHKKRHGIGERREPLTVERW